MTYMLIASGYSYVLYFVRSGMIYIPKGFNEAGLLGYGWSSRANSVNISMSYRLGFSKTGVFPSNGDSVRLSGYPLRCLARQ